MPIRMKANDSFYDDATKTVAAGDEFEVETEERAKALSDNGLAVRIGGEETAPEPVAPEPVVADEPKRRRSRKAAA